MRKSKTCTASSIAKTAANSLSVMQILRYISFLKIQLDQSWYNLLCTDLFCNSDHQINRSSPQTSNFAATGVEDKRSQALQQQQKPKHHRCTTDNTDAQQHRPKQHRCTTAQTTQHLATKTTQHR
ncbi:hypothetical protein LOK49_LG07G01938 [Camellia lanceoleosa]|uniref:Uncharacterized protein n=1 Tax=Camellia lanceoleosa TaxID=1840588 RepID=A0ACC0H2F0_9ERIC|nr:hypothetical protein LOK49_LG07G01938 [Camellia lanceoleosa]